MALATIDTALQTVAWAINKVKDVTNFWQTKSLVDLTKLTRVEPLTIISKDLINVEYMPDIMQSLLAIFSGYYLQGIDVLTKVNDVEVIRILDSLNPDRDETGFLLSERQSRTESMDYTLDVEKYKHRLPRKGRPALEAEREDGEVIKAINEMSALSVGKMLHVSINYGSDKSSVDAKSIMLPVQVRLMASVIPNLSIERILSSKSEDASAMERFHSWRAGRISFISDLIFCQDLIDEQKKATIQDESNTMQEILRRVTNAKQFGLLTKNPSLVSASNLFVISEEIAEEVANKLGGKFSNAKVREKAFDATYAMIIAVVSREWERVTFYTRDVAAGADFSVKEIKAAGKGKGPDIMDIFKNINHGMPPSF